MCKQFLGCGLDLNIYNNELLHFIIEKRTKFIILTNIKNAVNYVCYANTQHSLDRLTSHLAHGLFKSPVKQ